jgi:hypothetical protein
MTGRDSEGWAILFGGLTGGLLVAFMMTVTYGPWWLAVLVGVLTAVTASKTVALVRRL